MNRRNQAERNAPQKAVVLDLGVSRLSLSSLEVTRPFNEASDTYLRLAPAKPHTRTPEGKRTLLYSLDAALQSIGLSDSVLYFGALYDPFLPSGADYETVLEALNLIARSPVKMVVIQTRSPLIVLALPLLRSLENRVAVTIAVETLDPASAQILSPIAPPPAERLKAAAALKNLGIATVIQATPLFPGGKPTPPEVMDYTLRIAASCHGVRLASPVDIVRRKPEAAQFASLSSGKDEVRACLMETLPALLPENWGRPQRGIRRAA